MGPNSRPNGFRQQTDLIRTKHKPPFPFGPPQQPTHTHAKCLLFGMPPATGKGTQGVFLAHCGQGEIFILLKWVVVKYSGVPLPVAGGIPNKGILQNAFAEKKFHILCPFPQFRGWGNGHNLRGKKDHRIEFFFSTKSRWGPSCLEILLQKKIRKFPLRERTGKFRFFWAVNVQTVQFEMAKGDEPSGFCTGRKTVSMVLLQHSHLSSKFLKKRNLGRSS